MTDRKLRDQHQQSHAMRYNLISHDLSTDQVTYEIEVAMDSLGHSQTHWEAVEQKTMSTAAWVRLTGGYAD